MNPTIVHESSVKCDGKNSDKNATSDGEVGHPAVYLHVNSKDVVHCPYCSRSFVFGPNSE
ncbi:MAG: zinc-finger domain-containing protein [Pseudomonadota bacterium]